MHGPSSYFDDYFHLIIIVPFIIGLGVALIVLLSNVNFQGYGNGQHVGYVTAVETNGTFWKTDRIYVKTDTSSSQEDAYCVLSEEVMEKARAVADTHERVRLIYEDQGFTWGNDCDSEHTTVVDIELIPGTK